MKAQKLYTHGDEAEFVLHIGDVADFENGTINNR